MNAPSTAPPNTLRSGLQRIEGVFDLAFGARANPLRQLGALAFLLFWLVAATGIYLYAAFDTSVSGAYASVDRISRNQWPLGAIAHSVHRYASDAMLLVVLLHLAREWIAGHARGFRWFSWLSGVPLLWFLYASGIGGYWLVWDRLAQFSLNATAEWFDWLPMFGEPMVRNFIVSGSVTDRLFSLLIFLHIGMPLILLLGMWVHIQRISRPLTQPHARIAIGLPLALVALSLALPAAIQAPADLSIVPSVLGLDWFYLAVFAALYASSAATLWQVAGGATLLLALLPWLPPRPREPAAIVDLAHCNGCGRCFADCPYAAVTMRPRSDGRKLPGEAVVDPDLCAACGICAGACPSSTPFRRAGKVLTGIDLPQQTMSAVRRELSGAIAALRGRAKIVVIGCLNGADIRGRTGPDTAAIRLVCTAMLPPSFVDYTLRAGADGVLITGCRDGDCEYRLGNRWTEERLLGSREPRLRAAVPQAMVHVCWAAPGDLAMLLSQIDRFRRAILSTPKSARDGLGPPPSKEVLHE